MPVCDDRSILVAIQVDRYCTASCLFDDTCINMATLSNFSLWLSGRQRPSGAISCRATINYGFSAVRREIAPLLAYGTRLEGAKYDFYSSSWEHLVSFYLPLGN